MPIFWLNVSDNSNWALQSNRCFECSVFSAASGQQNGQFDRITNFMKIISKFMKLDTSTASDQKNGQSDQKRNFANGKSLANRRER